VLEWLDFTDDYFKKRNATMLIKLGKVKFTVYEPNSEELESVKINIEVTPDEYIFYKTGLFSSKEIGKIQRKDVTEITNENMGDRGILKNSLAEKPRFLLKANYLTFLKEKSKSVEILFDNKTSSDVDKIITKLK